MANDDKTKEAIALHVAGATVRHSSEFSSLEVFENKERLDKSFIGKYVIPFYLGRKGSKEFRDSYLEIRSSITVEVVYKLLGDFNWRPRSVGAYFAALNDFDVLEGNIGRLLLRSDVCYAGHDYCIALAAFASEQGIEFLNQYLDYYLGRTELWFDQNSAMSALAYLSREKGEDLVGPHMAAWERFVEDKPSWNLENSINHFNEKMVALNEFRHEIS